MGKENLILPGQEEIKSHVQKTVVNAVGEFLAKDTDTTVSEAQVAAYLRVVDALPEGRLKDLADRLKGVQQVSSKLNEFILNMQDTSWRVIKPIVTLKAPLAAGVPSKPFSKIAIKTSGIGSDIGVKVIKGVVNQTEKIKAKLKKPKEIQD